MSLFGKGIWSSVAKRFAHSTSRAGVTCELKTSNMVASAWAYLSSIAATTNYGDGAEFRVGESNAAVDTNRGWIKPNLAAIPNGSQIVSATLRLSVKQDLSSNARTMRVHRCLRATVNTQATWNIFSTGNNWGTAGASNSITDYDGAVELGNVSIAASPAQFTTYDISLSVAEIQKMYNGTYTNNGLIVFVDTQSSDLIVYYGTPPVEGELLAARFIITYY
jgi:hypothetical protein